MQKVNPDIMEYVQKNIFPVYDTFDKGHDSNHAKAVISRSLGYHQFLNDDSINLDMVYVVAAYHDTGNVVSRKNHAFHSSQYLLADKNLEKWFSAEQIQTMADACEDHSTSSHNPPRTIYGKIVCDADKDDDVEVGLLRGWEYAVKHSPHLSLEEKIDNIHREIARRFGENGVVVFYISYEGNKHFLQEMQKFSHDKEYFTRQFTALGKKNHWF